MEFPLSRQRFMTATFRRTGRAAGTKRAVGAHCNTYTSRERGQALVETAMVLVGLMMMLSIIVDAGRMMFTWLALQNAAAEGAYYATTFDTIGVVDTTDPTTVIYRTQHESPSDLLDWTKPGVTVTVTYTPSRAPNPQKAGDFVTVRISYPFDIIGPLPGLFGFPTRLPIRAQATQVVLANFR